MAEPFDVDSIRASVDLARLVAQYGYEIKHQGGRTNRYKALCPFHTEETPSFEISEYRGKQRYKCWGCGVEGDVFSFYAAMHNLDLTTDFPKICKALSNGTAGGPEIPRAPLKKPPPRITSQPPATLEPNLMLRSGKEPISHHPYLTATSDLLGYAAWYDGEDEPRYWTWGKRTPEDIARWEPLPFFAPRPLYGLEQLARKPDPDVQVIIVEDERTADAAQRLFPALACISWPGGLEGIKAADWSPMKGRNGLLIPQNDPAGWQVIARLASELLEREVVDLRMVETDRIPQSELPGSPDVPAPEGWNLRFALESGWTPETAMAWAKRHVKQYQIPMVPAPEVAALSEAGAVLPPPPAPAPAPPEAGTNAAPQQMPPEAPRSAAIEEALASIARAQEKSPSGAPGPPSPPELGVVDGNTVRKPKRKLEVAPEDILPEGYTDDDLADKWSAANAGEWRYTPLWRKWHFWNGAIWEFDEVETIHHKARLFLRKILSEAPPETLTKKNRKEIMTDGHTNSILRFASHDPRHATRAADWDADPMLLGTPGGIVDLRMGKIIESDRAQLISRSTTCAPAEGPHPLFDMVLARPARGDPDLLAYLWRWLGYMLTGDTRAEAMLFLHGVAGSGKGTLIKVIADILHDYAKGIDIHALLENKNERHPQEIAKLAGARFVYASETSENMRWDEAKIKWLTGRDKIVARKMRMEDEEFYPQFKLLVYGNEKPTLKGVDEGIRRRLHMIEYAESIAAEDRDETLKDRIVAEYPSILHSMILGCLDWQYCCGLGMPESVSAATERYLSQNDVLGEFLEDCIERDNDAHEKTGNVYQKFREFSVEHGQKYIMAQGIFSQRMEARGFELARTNRDGRIIRGLRIKIGEPPARVATYANREDT